jgi:hypothetical protein
VFSREHTDLGATLPELHPAGPGNCRFHRI